MLKRVIILLTSLAYSLTLVHSLVPHHHDETAQIHSHHHDDHSNDHHHDDGDEKTLIHFFSDAVHHPSAEITIHSSHQENVPKTKTITEFFILTFNQILLPELKPPDNLISHQVGIYSISLFSVSLLRAPPAI